MENEQVQEGYPMVIPGEGPSEQQDRETENVTYSKTKTKGDASVTISANAKSMQELHDVLKLAGITLPKDRELPEPHEHPEIDDTPCGSPEEEPQVSMSPVDKSVLTGMLRDKLSSYLRNGR